MVQSLKDLTPAKVASLQEETIQQLLNQANSLSLKQRSSYSWPIAVLQKRLELFTLQKSNINQESKGQVKESQQSFGLSNLIRNIFSDIGLIIIYFISIIGGLMIMYNCQQDQNTASFIYIFLMALIMIFVIVFQTCFITINVYQKCKIDIQRVQKKTKVKVPQKVNIYYLNLMICVGLVYLLSLMYNWKNYKQQGYIGHLALFMTVGIANLIGITLACLKGCEQENKKSSKKSS